MAASTASDPLPARKTCGYPVSLGQLGRQVLRGLIGERAAVSEGHPRRLRRQRFDHPGVSVPQVGRHRA